MAEENNSIDNRLTSSLPFEEFVRQKFELVFARSDNMSSEVNGLRHEMIERFIQLTRQIKAS
jgi:hypothetical protein